MGDGKDPVSSPPPASPGDLPTDVWAEAVDSWSASLEDLDHGTLLDAEESGMAPAPITGANALAGEPKAAAQPRASALDDDSGTLQIPDLDALSAAYESVRTPTPVAPPAHVPESSYMEPDGTEPLEVFALEPEEVLLIEDAGEAGAAPDPFSEAPPADEDVPLEPPADVPPLDLQAFLAQTPWDRVVAPNVAPTAAYREERFSLLAEELQARQAEGATGDQLAWVAVEAARAAHAAGAIESMHGLIDRACQAAPDAVAPRRERLRLLAATAPPHEDPEAVARRIEDVAARAGAERAPYESAARAYRLAFGLPWVAPQKAAAEELGPQLCLARLAWQRDDLLGAAAAFGEAGRALGGALGAELLLASARWLELRCLGDRGTSFRALAQQQDPDALAHVVGALRWTGGFAPGDALMAVQRLLPRVPEVALREALGRWACGLAESQGNTWGAELLRSVLDGQPMTALNVADRMALLPLHLGELIENPEGWVEGLTPESAALVLTTAAEMILRTGRPADAFRVLEEARQRAPNAVFVSLFAERLAHALSPGEGRLAALLSWASGDAARAGMALLDATAEAASLGDRARVGALQAGAFEALPGDAVFLTWAWSEMAARQWKAATRLLEAGAQRLEALGEVDLAQALRENAEDLQLAGAPTRAVVRAMARSSSAEETMDHPRVLALAPLEKADVPGAIAAVYRSAAMSSRHVNLRVLEALSWMKAAGQRRQAIQFLQGRWSGLPSPSASMMMRVLANTFDDAASAAAVFEKLALTARIKAHEGFWSFRRAEALAASGHEEDAVAVLRELAPAALQLEAEVLYRRLLWRASDLAPLDALLRDEVDGYLGVGGADKASVCLVERAHVRSQALSDLPGAASLLAEALALAPSAAGVGPRAIVAGAMLGQAALVVTALEAMAAASDPDAAFVRVLVAESQLDTAAAAKWRDAGLRASPTRLALLQRTLTPNAPVEAWQRAVDALAGRPDGDVRLPLALQVRLAEALGRAGRFEEALTRLEATTAADPGHVPALRLLIRVARAAQQPLRAARPLELAGEACALPAHKSRAFLEAAGAWSTQDPEKAEALLRRSLAADGGNEEAFARLRSLLEARQDAAGLAEVIRVRQQTPVPAGEAERLRLERAALLEKAGDRAGAKGELRALLVSDPQNALALEQLVELEYQDGAYSIAAELYLRLARLQTDPQSQVKSFRRLGRIYHRRLSDPKLAAGAFERVLKLAPDDLRALTGLSEIYTKQNDLARAIGVTERALALEPDAKRRLTFLLRLSALHEKNNEAQVAGNLLRRAVDLAPRSLQAIGEMARHYERHKDVQARRVLLETSLSRLYEDLRRSPGDLSALRTIVPVLRWCARAAGSAATAQLLAALSDDPAERREMAAWSVPPAKGRRLTPLVNPEVDEMAYSSRLPPGLRQVMRILGPPLSRVTKPDLRPFGVTRAERLGVGEGPRAIVDAMAVDLGVRGFEVFISKEVPNALTVLPGDPPAIVLGSELVERGPVAVRFCAGFTLRLVATHFDLLAAEDPGGPALLLALVRQFVPASPLDPSVDERGLDDLVPRLNKALGRSLRTELRPFVAEMASPESLASVTAGVEETAARVGLLASGDLAVSLDVLLSARGSTLTSATLASTPLATGLLDFVLSSDYELLVRSLDSIS